MGAWLLVLLMLQSACATGRGAERSSASWAPGVEGQGIYDVAVIERGDVATKPVPVARAEFQRAMRGLAKGMRWKEGLREAARRLLEVGLEEEWLAEVYREQVLTLTPMRAGSMLSPEAERGLRERYLQWCGRRGEGDCLDLLDDGPYLRAEDRRTLALSLALEPVLEETREAVASELHPEKVVALLVWTAGLYLGLWLVPEPTTKTLAAALTVVLVGWLGVDAVWGLMDGWARLVTRAHEASGFDELRAAGDEFARVLGREAARGLILGVGAVVGGSLGELVARVRALPGFMEAGGAWVAQSQGVGALSRVRAEDAARALAVAVQEAYAVELSVEGALTVVMLKKGVGGRPGRGAARVIRHRGGNQQVVMDNGQRWHLPRGRGLEDIPTRDPLGDELQEAATRAAREWGSDKLTRDESAAIENALERGEYWLARLLEREARGRFVHRTVKNQFSRTLQWRDQGVDAVDLGTGHRYELLSNTESNLARHGRRMASEFFRMLTF
ncbi:MAG: hypothetical protein ABW123_03020 [Cystobacter sp.]